MMGGVAHPVTWDMHCPWGRSWSGRATAASFAAVANDAEGLIKALGFVAWSDKRLAPEERELLDNVMDALGIPAARREELCAKLQDGPPSIEAIGDDFSDEMEKRFALAQAVMMAQADGHVDAAEKRDIDTLARALEIDPDEVQMIYAAVDVTKNLVPDE